MYNSAILIVCGFTVVITIMLVGMFHSRIGSAFHLADSRRFFGSENSYQKLNSMMNTSEVSMYNMHFMGEHHYTILITHKGEDGHETSSNRFQGDNLEAAIDQAYNWTKERGFINE